MSPPMPRLPYSLCLYEVGVAAAVSGCSGSFLCGHCVSSRVSGCVAGRLCCVCVMVSVERLHVLLCLECVRVGWAGSCPAGEGLGSGGLGGLQSLCSTCILSLLPGLP